MERYKYNYFTTGEFAKLCNVTKHTLFHYDRERVFSPEIKAENGYRYYSAAQFDDFEVIVILRNLGMPLKKIRKYLASRTSSEMIKLFKYQEEVIDKKIEKLKNIKRFMHKRVQLTEEAIGLNTEEVAIHDEEAEYYIKSADSWIIDDKSVTIALANLITLCKENNITSPYSIGGLHTMEDIENGVYDRYSHFYIRTDSGSKSVPAHVKPAGKYLVVHHKGGFETTSKSYQKVLDYAKENNLKLSGDFHEDVLLGNLCEKGYRRYLLKISVKIDLPN